jgi:hypothetical protein
MALSMFQACVPVITQLLNGLSVVVDKTAAHVAEKKYDEQAFLQSRLVPDMFPLGRQIRQATDFGRNAPGRLAGVDLPAFPDADASFAEANARIAKSIDFVKGFTPAQIDGTEDKDISWKAGERTMSFKGQAYLLHFCLPHFFFHCTTAYNIARHNGVEIGKRDYMGTL